MCSSKYMYMCIEVVCMEGIIGNAVLRPGLLCFMACYSGKLFTCIHVFIEIVCMESLRGNAQASASWFDILSWLISIYTYMFVLKLCVLSAIWAMCTGLGLNGLMFLPWHIYVCMYWGASWAMCKPRLHGLMFCHRLYVYVYMYVLKLCVWSSSWAICRPQLHVLMFFHLLYVLGLCMMCLMPYAQTSASWFGVL